MLIVRIATTPIVKPAGRTGGNWVISIKQNGDHVAPPYSGTVPETPWPTALPVGVYQLEGHRVDTANATLGDVVEGTYNWTGEGAEMVDVAAGISVVNV